jgi:hypothetical protein
MFAVDLYAVRAPHGILGRAQPILAGARSPSPSPTAQPQTPARTTRHIVQIARPLLSYSYRILLPQPLCFDIHVVCPGGVPPTRKVPCNEHLAKRSCPHASLNGELNQSRTTDAQPISATLPPFAAQNGTSVRDGSRPSPRRAQSLTPCLSRVPQPKAQPRMREPRVCVIVFGRPHVSARRVTPHPKFLIRGGHLS